MQLFCWPSSIEDLSKTHFHVESGFFLAKTLLENLILNQNTLSLLQRKRLFAGALLFLLGFLLFLPKLTLATSPKEQPSLFPTIEIPSRAKEQAGHLLSFNGYRTVTETEKFLQEQATNYPQLAKLVEFGNSWERLQYGITAGHTLQALRLTNKAIPGPKPVFTLLAAIHARELPSSELATRLISYLLTKYNSDPDVTWLLDENEVVIVPLTNPDGRVLAEKGYSQRKNTNSSYGGYCTFPPTISNQSGVDLNRNFSFEWGSVDGPNLNPCSELFPGNAAASEPETQALQAFLTSLYPNHPKPGQGEAAPADTSGIVISLHSYGNLILWPWGYTLKPSPNATELAQIGKRLAQFNGYQPAQAIQLYPTSGTVDDWTYAELGIPIYTFEVGPFAGGCSDFNPPFVCLDGESGGNFWASNLPAFLYAARIARAPYSQAQGPDLAVQKVAQVISDTSHLTLTLTFTNSQVISGAEVFVTRSDWLGNSAISLKPLQNPIPSNTSTSSILGWQATLPRNLDVYDVYGARKRGEVLILVRGSDSAGVWGPIRAVWLPPLSVSKLFLPLVQKNS